MLQLGDKNIPNNYFNILVTGILYAYVHEVSGIHKTHIVHCADEDSSTSVYLIFIIHTDILS